MSDLIRREDVTDILADLYLADERLLNFKTEIDAVYDKMLALPSADAVEVVRCRDCKYYKEYIGNNGSAMMCFCPCCIGGQGRKSDDDYCSYGEREGE